MFRFLPMRLAALLSAIILVAAACQAEVAPEVTEAPAPEVPEVTPAPDEPEEPVEPVEVEKPELTFANASVYRSFDTHLMTASSFSAPYVWLVYDRLADVDAEGLPKPMLATGWEIIDSRTIEFDLRDDVIFHDGTPFNADAVLANMDRAQNHPETTLTDLLAFFESTEKVDDYTVRFHMTGDFAGIVPNLMADQLGTIASPSAWDDDDFGLFPVGAGAYKVVDHVPGEHFIVEPFEGYYNPEAQLASRITIRILSDEETVVSGIAGGVIDAAIISPGSAERAIQAGLQVSSPLIMNPQMIDLNVNHPALGDPLVRKAINHALDRDAISEVGRHGFCTPSATFFSPVLWTSDPQLNWREYYDYDPARARELLAEAGFPDGFSFEWAVLNQPIYLPIAEMIAAQLADVGIQANVQIIDTAAFNQVMYLEQTADAIMGGTGGIIEPSIQVAQRFLPGGFRNAGDWYNEEVERLHHEGMAAVDRAPIYQQLDRLLLEEPMPLIILCHVHEVLVGGQDVVGLEISTTGYRDIRTWTKPTE